jgi:hypothetical protein
MRFRVCLSSDVFGGTGKGFSIVAASMLGIALMVATSTAGDLSPQPADSLSITNSSKLLPQTQAAEESWLSGLHVSGYVNQTFGMWQNPHNTHEWTHSSNALAVSRTLLQVDENYRLNESNTFFMREWFVYEPPYAFNSSNNTVNSAVQNGYLSPFCGKTGSPSSNACFTGREVAPAMGHFTNDFYNNYNVRDVWWQNKLGPLTTFVGNQIVVWGQSLAFRVGDVINPQDFAWNFGFANLEQSRNPQWMIHPILNLPEVGPFQSNFLEVLVQPGFQPQWWENSYYDNRFGGPGGDDKDGRVATYGTHSLSQRFDVAYDNQARPEEDLTASSGPGPSFGFATQFSSPGNNTQIWKPSFYLRCNTGNAVSPGSAPNGCWEGGSIIGAPLLHTFWNCLGGGQIPIPISKPNAPKFFNPLPPGMQHSQGSGCNLTLSHNNNPLGAAGDYALWDFGLYHIPGMQPSNWNEGARIHTLIGSTELTALYYNDNMDGGFPTPRFGGPGAPYYTNLGRLDFMDIQEIGVTADRPMPIPAALGEYLPVVGRAEALYTNHQPFMNDNPLALSGIRYSDTMKWMVALDIDQAYAPWLTSTGNLTAFFEVYDNITLDNNKVTPVGPLISARNDKNQVFSLASIGTGFFWEDVEPTWTMIYQPAGTTLALFPTLVLNPPWTKKYFVKLQAIEVMGGNRLQGLGLFKGQSLLTASFQYNFNLL